MILNSIDPKFKLPEIDPTALNEEECRGLIRVPGFLGQTICFHWTHRYRSSSNLENFEDILDDLAAQLDAISMTTYSPTLYEPLLQTCMKNIGKRLFDRGISVIQNHFDDRPLYWARIWSRIIVKHHKIWTLYTTAKILTWTVIQDKLDILEASSRNFDNVDFYTDITGNIISSATKRYLFTGFDNNISSLKDAKRKMNVSAVIAGYFHGKTLVDDDGNNAYVQAIIFPTRYREFRNQTVKNILTPFFQAPKKVDLIISWSEDPTYKNSNELFLERFAVNYEGSTQDNNKVAGLNRSLNGFEIKQSTLPKGLIFQDVSYTIKFRQTVFYVFEIGIQKISGVLNTVSTGRKYELYKLAGQETYSPNNITITMVESGDYFLRYGTDEEISEHYVNINIDFGFGSGMGRPLQSGIQLYKGSGGYYLSNRIFLEISTLRDNAADRVAAPVSIPTGHIHVPTYTKPNMPDLLDFIQERLEAVIDTLNDRLSNTF